MSFRVQMDDVGEFIQLHGLRSTPTRVCMELVVTERGGRRSTVELTKEKAAELVAKLITEYDLPYL